MRFTAPVERTVRTNLMLAHGTGFGEKHITCLYLVLDVLLRIRTNTYKSFCRPKRGDIFVASDMRLIIRHLVLLPSAEIAVRGIERRVVIPMSVLVVVYIPAFDTEIEVAGRERMLEIQAQFAFTQSRRSPFCMMTCMHIEDRVLAVIEMVSEPKERVRMTDCTTDIAVIGCGGFKTCRLRQQRIKSSRRLYRCRIVRILDRGGFDVCLYHSRFGGYFSCSLYNRLKIPFNRHRPIQRTVVLGESAIIQDA